MTAKISRWQVFRLRALDFLADVVDVTEDTTRRTVSGAKRAASAAWRGTRYVAGKIKPSFSVVWSFLVVPAFTVGLLFAIKTFGSMDDLFAYVIEIGARSLPVLVAIALTYLVSTRLGWNLDNTYRKELQAQLSEEGAIGSGAFLILAGELLGILSLLGLFLTALLVWQG